MKKVSESGNICLNADVVFATHMSYKRACRALTLANKSGAAEFFKFSIHIGPETENLYWLVGLPIKATEAFIASPEAFILKKEELEAEGE